MSAGSSFVSRWNKLTASPSMETEALGGQADILPSPILHAFSWPNPPSKAKMSGWSFYFHAWEGDNGQNQLLAGEFVWQLPGNSQQERI